MSDVYESFISKYTSKSRDEGSKEYRAETIVTLQEYIKFVEESMKTEEEQAKEFRTPTLIDVNDKAAMIIGVLSYFSREAHEKLLRQYRDFADETIEITKYLCEKIKQDEDIEADYESFIKEMKRKISTNSTLLKLRFYVESLTKKMDGIASRWSIGNVIDPISRELQSAFYNFDPSINYVKVPNLDKAISIYLHHTHFSNMLYPISRIIADGDVKAALIALSELTELVYVDTRCAHPTAKVCLYLSIVRAVFEEAYTIYPELNRFAKANAVFQEKCEAFADRTIGDIQSLMPKDTLRGYTPGMQVRTLFRKKQIGYMKDMELMLNPIDLMVQIYKSVNSLKHYFSFDAGTLTFRETNILLLVLLSVAPPSNTVSIARFLDHWKDMVLTPVVKDYVSNFIGAVELLYSYEQIEEDENESD